MPAEDSDQVRVHREAVLSRIERARRAGRTEFVDILKECDGADPEFVADLLDGAVPIEEAVNGLSGAADSGWNYRLPASDPERSQWWFASSAIEHLAERVWDGLAEHSSDARVLCLGSPSLAGVLEPLGERLTVLDADRDVLEAVRLVAPSAVVREYDANSGPPEDLLGQFAVCVTDPPWYSAAIRTFIARALALLATGGELCSTLPGALTRPGLPQFRASLIAELTGEGHELVALERGVVRYQVPLFEQAALSSLKRFKGIPWRAGDVIHLRKATSTTIQPEAFSGRTARTFSRVPSHFRVFVAEKLSSPSRWGLRRLENYSSHISTRRHVDEIPDVWSSEKVGLVVDDLDAVVTVLEAWKNGVSRDEFLRSLSRADVDDKYQELTRRLDEELGLWERFASASPLRSPEEIEKQKSAGLSDFAASPSEREHHQHGDGYRPRFSRDRDRVLWSASLRRLSDKTQLFPSTYDDDLRRRLSHSIEVLQLASTIGDSFGLNRDLIEVGALAHDIGHTPFGHEGEYALNLLLKAAGLPMGFNHYEHGVDVVRYLEGPYYESTGTGFHGLNLTPEVAECIIKHTYCHSGDRGLSCERVLEYSKHQGIVEKGYCHLEGQAVRAADKISYFLSDLEDGVRLGAVAREHLLACRFFHRPPLRFAYVPGESLREQFVRMRRHILSLLMEDVIQATSKRLSRMVDRSVKAVRGHDDYLVQHSGEVQSDMDEVWEEIQKKRLHRDRRVVAANLHAGRVVSVLAIACALEPDLIEPEFRREYERLLGSPYIAFYAGHAKTVTLSAERVAQVPVSTLINSKHEPGRAAEIDTHALVQAKDYVAGLTDSRASALYEQLMHG